jgi:hypothetical protein
VRYVTVAVCDAGEKGHAMIERGFWRHLPTGNIWAVETEGQKPVKCAGPLDERDLDLMLLPYLDYSTAYLRLVEAEWDLYVPHELCSACGSVLRPGAAVSTNGGQWHVHLRCSLKPPEQGQSAGAAVLVESLWQCSARLRHTSRVLRNRSQRLQARCRSARSTYALPPVA